MLYVAGLDVGATKSHFALYDDQGNQVDFAEWGPLNHEVLPGGFDQLEKELEAFANGTLRRHGLTPADIGYAVFGMGGCDTRAQHRTISDIWRRLGWRDFLLCNDAYLGIPAGSPDCVGICAINGSGCTLAGINAGGKTLQIGGIGDLSNDKGGGGTLGTRVIAAAYSSLFRKAPETALTERVFAQLGISDKYDFFDALADFLEGGERRINVFTPMLFEVAGAGDAVAVSILREVADNYAGGITALIEELDFPAEKPLYIVMAGSVFVKGASPVLIDALKEMLAQRNPGYDLRYVLLERPPVMGAITWARKLLAEKRG